MEEDYSCWLQHHKKAQGHEKRFMSRLGESAKQVGLNT